MILKSSEKTDVNMTELVATVDAETFEKAIEAVYQQQKKNISLPGFRKGKVPRRLCERTYGEGVFFEDALNLILNMEMPGVIAEAALNLVDAPKVEVTSVSKEDGATVKIICVTKPEIHIADYKGMTAPKEDKEITDEDVAKQAENVCKRNAKMVSVDDRAAEMGDEVTLDFEGFFGDTPFEGGKGEDFQLKLGSGQFIPGFEEQVAGHKIDEDFDVTVTFPEDYHAEDLKGKEAVFKCTVHEIKAKELPEIDDEFAAEVSEFDTLEEYKADVKAKIKEQKAADGKRNQEDQAVEQAVKNAEYEIPQPMIETQTTQMVEDFAQRIQSQGITLEQYFQFTGLTAEKMMEDMKPQAIKRIETRLVLEAIAKAENIEITDEKVDEELAKMAESYKMEVEKLKEFMGENEKKQMKEDLAVQEAVTFLVENAVEK